MSVVWATLLAVAFAAAAEEAPAPAAFDVTLAPDQPIACAYTDEPLVVRWVAPQDATIEGRIAVFENDVSVYDQPIEPIKLTAGSEHWSVVDDLPVRKGRYRVEFNLMMGNEPVTLSRNFCRIDRPEGPVSLPFGIRVNRVDPVLIFALQSIPVEQVLLQYEAERFADDLIALTDAGLIVNVAVEPAGIDDAATVLEALAKEHGAKINGWLVGPDLGGMSAGQAIEALRSGGSNAPVTLFASKGPPLIQEMRSNLPPISSVGMEWDAPMREEIATLRYVLELQGRERLPMLVVGSMGPRNATQLGPQLVHQTVNNAAAGVACTYFGSRPILDGNQPTDGFMQLAGLADQLSGMQPAGSISVGTGVNTRVFRNLDEWVVVCWRAGGDAADVSISVGEAEDLGLADSAGNRGAAPKLENGSITFGVGFDPVYVRGKKGTVLAQAAQGIAREEAKTLANHEALKDSAPVELMEIFRSIANANDARIERLRFFDLLRAMPYLERQWREGAMSTDAAVPVIASLARLIRALCVLEEAGGEAFLDTVQETLSRSDDYINGYLAEPDSLADWRARSKWIIDESKRLGAEASALRASGREIEATAVAALAEWRARSLETSGRNNGNGGLQ